VAPTTHRTTSVMVEGMNAFACFLGCCVSASTAMATMIAGGGETRSVSRWAIRNPPRRRCSCHGTWGAPDRRPEKGPVRGHAPRVTRHRAGGCRLRGLGSRDMDVAQVHRARSKGVEPRRARAGCGPRRRHAPDSGVREGEGRSGIDRHDHVRGHGPGQGADDGGHVAERRDCASASQSGRQYT
jgi:hypothetical protein